MTVGRTIAKLEALLGRVRARAAEPRSAHGVPAVLAPLVPLEAPIEEEDDNQPTLPPPPAVELVAETREVVAIDVSAREREATVATPVADSPAQSLDSRERLVAASPALELVVEEPPPEPESAPEMEARDERVEDEPPVSSRRPVMPEPEQRIEEIAFGAEEPSPPRHSPPPESGRLLAAPVALDATKDVAADTEPQTRDLMPEAIVADLSRDAKVADVIGDAQRFAPSSFVELLDASLAL